MLSQGIAGPRFEKPEEVVEWMGAMQAQDIRAAKWAVGLRIASPSLTAVQEALDTGRILRLHVMRPTWHYIPGRDIKWMTGLSTKGLLSKFRFYAKHFSLTEEDFLRSKPQIEEVLSGQHLTSQEVLEQLHSKGIALDEPIVKMYLSFGEADGTVCSGIEKNGKHTYALTCERIPDAIERSHEEALAELTRRYFRSHGPATLEDFVWWSALNIGEARNAIASLGTEMITERYNDREMLIHEYLVSYKNRLDCIKEAHTKYAYNNFGIFQSVILHQGRITGNWRKTSKKGVFDTSFFPGCRPAAKKLIEKAIKECVLFHES